MRPFSWMPGTTLVTGVRLAALGAIVARSVCGVNANAGRPAMALLAGVVSGLVVVRSALSTQVASARAGPNCCSSRSQAVEALAASGTKQASASTGARRRSKVVIGKSPWVSYRAREDYCRAVSGAIR